MLAKKTKGKFGEREGYYRWVLFKTDQPGTYLPKHKAWSDLVIEKNSWGVAAKPFQGDNRIYGSGERFQ